MSGRSVGQFGCSYDKILVLTIRGNPNVPNDTLVITVDPHKQFGGYATIGYNPEEWDSRPHRHQMRLSWADWHMKVSALQHWLAAHEIGHVLGLTHEYQRADRKWFPKYLFLHLP